MSRKSSIKRLPAPIRAEIDRLIREDVTLDEIVAALRQMGAQASRSAVGRYRQSEQANMEFLRRVRETTRVWGEEFGARPEGETGRLLTHMVEALLFQAAAEMGDEPATPADLLRIATANARTAGARRAHYTIARDERAQIAAKAEKIGRARGLTQDTIDEIKAGILGVKADG